jgi:predicted nucleotidyltransferase
MTNLTEILAELRREFAQILGGQFAGLYLYGSQARGDAYAGSDIDVLVVMRGEFDYPELLSKTSEVVARLSLENDVVISRAFVSQDCFDREQSPFLMNIRREAVEI